MNAASKIVSAWSLIALLLGFAQCSKIDVEQPSPTDTTAILLPVFHVAIDSSGKGSFSLDTLITKYPDFSLRFDPMVNGIFVVNVVKREARFEKNNDNWTIDSTEYELCVSGHCKIGKVVVRNYVIPIASECDSIAPIGPISVGQLGQVIIPISPRRSWGKVTEIRQGFYNATFLTDSTKIQFRAVGNPNYYGFDEVGYTLVDSLGKCHRGVILFTIGDPCEATAFDDALTLTGNYGEWPVSQFHANDVDCSGPVDGLQFRISPQINYGNHLSIPTKNGTITDTIIGTTQLFQYRKRNLAATKDSCWYYIYDAGNSLKITRAKIRIKLE